MENDIMRFDAYRILRDYKVLGEDSTDEDEDGPDTSSGYQRVPYGCRGCGPLPMHVSKHALRTQGRQSGPPTQLPLEDAVGYSPGAAVHASSAAAPVPRIDQSGGLSGPSTSGLTSEALKRTVPNDLRGETTERHDEEDRAEVASLLVYVCQQHPVIRVVANAFKAMRRALGFESEAEGGLGRFPISILALRCFREQRARFPLSPSSQMAIDPADAASVEDLQDHLIAFMGTLSLPRLYQRVGRCWKALVKTAIQSDSFGSHSYVPRFGRHVALNTLMGCEGSNKLYVGVLYTKLYFAAPDLPEWIKPGARTRVVLAEVGEGATFLAWPSSPGGASVDLLPSLRSNTFLLLSNVLRWQATGKWQEEECEDRTPIDAQPDDTLSASDRNRTERHLAALRYLLEMRKGLVKKITHRRKQLQFSLCANPYVPAVRRRLPDRLRRGRHSGGAASDPLFRRTQPSFSGRLQRDDQGEVNLHPEGYDPHTRNARSLIDMQVADKIQREISEVDGSEVGDDKDDFVHDDDFSDDNDVVHDDDEDESFPHGEDAALGEDDALEEDELELAGCGQERSLLPPSAEEEMPDERKIRPPYRRPIPLNPYKWLVLRGRKAPPALQRAPCFQGFRGFHKKQPPYRSFHWHHRRRYPGAKALILLCHLCSSIYQAAEKLYRRRSDNVSLTIPRAR
ncbi:hypothetical protein OC846_003837 [Tilletia horrida]|uniref:Uncharacterized protein n=1 Tax=Tilletia horrida TaxID=155126 RepID=A0AAN6GPC9_9BASI|nr:hypothetical protein OC846_003837 [Tilletia horrida]